MLFRHSATESESTTQLTLRKSPTWQVLLLLWCHSTTQVRAASFFRLLRCVMSQKTDELGYRYDLVAQISS